MHSTLEGFEVTDRFNPVAIEFGEDLVLLVHVAERPTEQDLPMLRSSPFSYSGSTSRLSSSRRPDVNVSMLSPSPLLSDGEQRRIDQLPGQLL
jgi:hypothetical protein